LWIGLAAAVFTLVAFGLRIGFPIYRERAAAREIERIGGLVERRQLTPDCLRKWISDERARAFGEVVAVNLDSTDVADAHVARLEGLTGLQRLHLNSTGITDVGIGMLQHLRSLQELDLSHTHVTDAGFRTVALLPRLRRVYLHGTVVSKSQIADAIRRNTGLEVYANGTVYR
jgi:hypothetical protein